MPACADSDNRFSPAPPPLRSTQAGARRGLTRRGYDFTVIHALASHAPDITNGNMATIVAASS